MPVDPLARFREARKQPNKRSKVWGRLDAEGAVGEGSRVDRTKGLF